jgi:phenylacetate-CoA ligase
LRAEFEALRSDAYRDKPVHRKKTSGSTGTSVAVVVDEEAQQFKRACTLRSDEWSGWRLGERKACVWGNPEYLQQGWRGWLRNTLLERAAFLDTLRMDQAAMKRFRSDLRRRPPSLLFGHAHSLYLFAEFCRAEGGAGFRPRGIVSTAMVLHDWERLAIEEVFGGKVTNRYGCEELSLIACECEQHDGLHINADSVYVEVLRPDGSPCQPGEVGAVVVTDLVNRAMPLIRYQVGDMAALSDRQCACGRGLPLLERIAGRVADYVVTPSGEMVSGISLTENFAMLVPGIAQLQIIQEQVDHFVFKIVRGTDWSPTSEHLIAQLVSKRFGAGVTYTCQFVVQIPQEPSGKYRFCISKVANPFHQLSAELVSNDRGGPYEDMRRPNF